MATGRVLVLVQKREEVPVQEESPPTEDKAARSRQARRSKNKGKGWEKEVVSIIAGAFGISEEDIVNARSGRKECDVQLSAEARRKFPFWVECKNEKTARVPAWIRQMEGDLLLARKAGKAYRTGMVVFKQHGDRTPYALIRFDHLLAILKEKLG
jgi:hypothetical protein